MFSSTNSLICPLSEPWLVKILQKLKPETLARMRRTCKKMDEFVECYRFTISKNSPRLSEIKIKIEKEDCVFSRAKFRPYRAVLLSDPYKQLSAFSFASICMRFKEVTSESFLKFTDTLIKLKLHCNFVQLFGAKGTQEILKVFSSVSAEHLLAWDLKEMSIQQFFSHPLIENLNSLTLDIKESLEFPENGLLEYVKSVASLEINFGTGLLDSGLRFFNTILQESSMKSADLGNLRSVRVRLPKNIDPSSFSKNLCTLYRTPSTSYGYLILCETLLEEFPSHFLMMESNAFKSQNPRHDGNSHYLKMSFHKKNKHKLKEIIFKRTGEEITDEMFDHIMENVCNQKKLK